MKLNLTDEAICAPVQCLHAGGARVGFCTPTVGTQEIFHSRSVGSSEDHGRLGDVFTTGPGDAPDMPTAVTAESHGIGGSRHRRDGSIHRPGRARFRAGQPDRGDRHFAKVAGFAQERLQRAFSGGAARQTRRRRAETQGKAVAQRPIISVPPPDDFLRSWPMSDRSSVVERYCGAAMRHGGSGPASIGRGGVRTRLKLEAFRLRGRPPAQPDRLKPSQIDANRALAE